MTNTAQIIEWFNLYRIDHRVDYVDGKPATVTPLMKLTVCKSGNYWSVNGRRVSRKFGAALVNYFN
jgi:hypothetical protein